MASCPVDAAVQSGTASLIREFMFDLKHQQSVLVRLNERFVFAQRMAPPVFDENISFVTKNAVFVCPTIQNSSHSFVRDTKR